MNLSMHHVYVIQSERTHELYFGRTKDLKQRLADHNAGRTKSTRDSRPWQYVYIESYRSKQDAVDREKQLKQYGNARTYVKDRIERSADL